MNTVLENRKRLSYHFGIVLWLDMDTVLIAQTAALHTGGFGVCLGSWK